jgi:hypothetical protein
VEGLLAANVAAYVFFFISYQLPRVNDIERTGPRVAHHAGAVASNTMTFLHMASYVVDGVNVDHNTVTEGQARVIFSRIDPNAKAPQAEETADGLKAVSWLRAMALQEQWCQAEITELWRLQRFLEAQLVAIVSEIELSRHAAGMKDVREKMMLRGNLTNTDMSAWFPNYWQCYEYARELERYIQRFRVSYRLDSTSS